MYGFTTSTLPQPKYTNNNTWIIQISFLHL